MEATKRPWRFDGNLILHPEKYGVGIIMPSCYEPQNGYIDAIELRANREFMERAVNSYDKLKADNEALVAALEGLFEHCSMIHKYWGGNCNQHEAAAAIEQATAALKAARGE